MRLSLRLILTFVMVISVTAALVMLLANRIITIQYNNLIMDAGVRYARRIAPALARYYERNGSWTGIDTTFAKLQENIQNAETLFPGAGQMVNILLSEDRLLLYDTSGKLVMDTHPNDPLPQASAAGLNKGLSIFAKNQQRVGTLVSASSLGAFTQAQRTFLTQINLWMLFATGLIILAVSVSSIFVARSILAPVRSLAQAAHKVAAGDLSHTLPAEKGDELAEMAVSFNLMVAQLKEQRELRRRSMADVAHELRTPLSVLQVELEGMEDGLTPATPENLRGLQTEVAHLNHLVEDLRMLSLVDAHEFSLDVQNLDLQNVIQDVFERLSDTARTKGINLTSNLQEGHLAVNGDSQRLSQVLINLVSNAFQHTPTGGSVVIGARRVQNWAQVWVHDTGAGIPPEDLPHIFERFYRSDKARSRAKGGSGLGLAIARSLVEAHGGKIWAESVEHQGANLIFVLPIRPDAAQTRIK